MTALSLHAYPRVQDVYALLPHGASMGAGYGPIVVAREPLALDDLRDLEIAVPGALTTAYLVAARARRLPLPRGAVREILDSSSRAARTPV